MTLNTLTESLFDKKIRTGEFFSIYDENELPAGFIANQDKLIIKVDSILMSAYSKYEAFVSSNLWPNKSIQVDICSKIISKKLVDLLVSFLDTYAKDYAIFGGVYDDLRSGDTYRGRFIVNSSGILCVEESVAQIWKVNLENEKETGTGTVPDGKGSEKS